MLLAHIEDLAAVLRTPTEAEPWRVLLSGCMAGWSCGVDGTSYGLGGRVQPLFDSGPAVALPFCPEDVGLGTPRTMPDLHGGDGRALLAGAPGVRVLDEHGTDLTEGMLAGARAMVAFALEHRVDLAVLTDMSAACGTSVISLGCRFDEPRRYQQGLGVAAAMLVQAGVPVVAQRDERTIQRLRALLDPGFTVDVAALDHHEHPWTREHFGTG